jgi:hypothetical protein
MEWIFVVLLILYGGALYGAPLLFSLTLHAWEYRILGGVFVR